MLVSLQIRHHRVAPQVRLEPGEQQNCSDVRIRCSQPTTFASVGSLRYNPEKAANLGLFSSLVRPETGVFPAFSRKGAIVAQSLWTAQMLVSLQFRHHRVAPQVRLEPASNKIVLMFESDALSQPPPG